MLSEVEDDVTSPKSVQIELYIYRVFFFVSDDGHRKIYEKVQLG